MCTMQTRSNDANTWGTRAPERDGSRFWAWVLRFWVLGFGPNVVDYGFWASVLWFWVLGVVCIGVPVALRM